MILRDSTTILITINVMSKTLSGSFASLIGLVALVPLAAGHGFLSQVSIDGQVYKGNVPNNYEGPSPIRLIDDVSPVKGTSNSNLSCGQNAVAAELVAMANPGSTIAFSWESGEQGSVSLSFNKSFLFACHSAHLRVSPVAT